MFGMGFVGPSMGMNAPIQPMGPQKPGMLGGFMNKLKAKFQPGNFDPRIQANRQRMFGGLQNAMGAMQNRMQPQVDPMNRPRMGMGQGPGSMKPQFQNRAMQVWNSF